MTGVQTCALPIFINNNYPKAIDVTIIYNESQVIKRHAPGYTWHIFPIDKNYDNAKTLMTLVNGKLREILNFDEIIF